MRSGFFNSEIIGIDENNMPIFDRAEQADFFAKYFSLIENNGITAGSFDMAINGLQTTLSPGFAFINGYFGWEDQITQIQFNSYSTAVYSIIARLNLADRSISVIMVNGSTAVRTADIYDLMLYKIKITAGQTAISPSSVTDCRNDKLLCGLTGANAPVDATTLGGESAEYYRDYNNLLNKPVTYSPANIQPKPLGTTEIGSSTDFARADHVHELPSLENDFGVGKVIWSGNWLSGNIIVEEIPNYKIILVHLVGYSVPIFLVKYGTTFCGFGGASAEAVNNLDTFVLTISINNTNSLRIDKLYRLSHYQSSNHSTYVTGLSVAKIIGVI